ncbi:MAG: hypothetical protein J7L54_07050 [Elusimicrobia bacterium]|nr:hypothetical protein [Elusimicrobiota bacterium]
MNFIYLLIFLFFTPYLQIFIADRIFAAAGVLSLSPSLYIASVALFAIKMPYGIAIVYSFFLGLASSVLYGFPVGLNAFAYILITFIIRKISVRFDLYGIGGQFVIVFAAMIFYWAFLAVFNSVWQINFVGFPAILVRAFFTALLFSLCFGLFFRERKGLI